MRIEESIVIDRPRMEVFAYLVDRRHDAEWMGSVVESEWLEHDDPLAVGRRGRMVLRIFGKRSETIDEVSEFVPGEHIAHRTVQGTLLLNTACLTKEEGRRTRTTVTGEADGLVGGKFGRLLDPFVAGIMRRGFKADLRRLKRILESERSATPARGVGSASSGR